MLKSVNTTNVTTYNQEKMKKGHFFPPWCLPSCAFSCAFFFICKHAVVIAALLSSCSNIADCLAFKLNIFD